MKPIYFILLIIVGWLSFEWGSMMKLVSAQVLGLETMGVFLTGLSLKAKKQLDCEGSLIKITKHEDSNEE